MSVGDMLEPASKLSLAQAAAAVLESRTEYRVGADFPVEIHSPDFDPPLRARARDVSTGGICLATPSPFVLDGVQSLTLHLPSGPLRLDAAGRWQKSISIDEEVLSGLAFVESSREQVSALWDVVHDTARELGSFFYKSLTSGAPSIDDAMNIAQICRIRLVARRTCIYQRGSSAEEDSGIFIVKQGQVELHLPVDEGSDVPVAVLGPGDLFGGLLTVASIPHLESAQASEETVLLEISRGAFSYIRLAKPLLAHWLGGLVMRSYVGRAEKMIDRAVEVLQPGHAAAARAGAVMGGRGEGGAGDS